MQEAITCKFAETQAQTLCYVTFSCWTFFGCIMGVATRPDPVSGHAGATHLNDISQWDYPCHDAEGHVSQHPLSDALLGATLQEARWHLTFTAWISIRLYSAFYSWVQHQRHIPDFISWETTQRTVDVRWRVLKSCPQGVMGKPVSDVLEMFLLLMCGSLDSVCVAIWGLWLFFHKACAVIINTAIRMMHVCADVFG